MHIAPGEKVVIIGPSGSGKSTFLRCLNLLEQPTSGSIVFDGQEITDPKADINEIRRHMGMVFQHFNLFNNLTVLDNITLAPIKLKIMTKKEAEAEAMRLLKLVNLEEVFHGVQTEIRIRSEGLGTREEGLGICDEGLGGKDYEGISLEEDYIFCGLPNRIPVGRYHSWVVDTEDFPEALAITAISPEGQIMALKHREYDIHGIQFHPESVLTPDGKTIVKNWLFK